MIHLLHRTRRPLGLWIVAALIALTAGCRNPAQNNPPQEQRTTVTRAPQGPAAKAPLQFIEKLTGGAQPKETLPWIVAVHGLGDRPSSFATLFDDLNVKARIVFPRAPQPCGSGFAWFPFRFGDQDPVKLAQGIKEAAGQVADLIVHLRANHSRFDSKPIVCGFSQGGMISYAIALTQPELIGGAIPISGLIPMEFVRKITPISSSWPTIWAMHGTADEVVPMAPTLTAIVELQKKGIAIKLKQYDGVRHAITGTMRRQLYDWLKELR